ncbi:MAG: hypothetical protein ACOH16_02390 [Propionibacteriaceae bacterium]
MALTLTAAEPDSAISLRPWWRRLPSVRVIVWVWLVAMAAVRAGTTQERDPYWEARAGIENLTGTPLVRPDSWSWAPVNDVFYPNSPGWNVLLGLSWLGGHYWGLFLFTFIVLLAYFGMAYVLARRLGAHPLGALAGATIGFILALPMLSARGTIGVQLMLWVGLFVPLWWRPRLARTSPVTTAVVLFAAGAALSAVGNWVHLSFVAMAVALAASWGVYWLASDWPTGGWKARLTDPRRWAALSGCLGLVVGIFATPYGIAMTLERTRVTQEVCNEFILEWVSPFTPMQSAQWPFVAVSMLLVLVGVVVWFARRLCRGPIDNTFALAAAICTMAVPFAVAGMFALRFLGVAALMLVPILGMGITMIGRRAQAWAQQLPDSSPFKEPGMRWTRNRSWRIVLSLVAALLLPFAVWLGPVNHAVPAEQEAIQSLPPGCNLFTTASIAGPTILTRHDVPVWFDGRADYFGRARLLEGHDYFSGVAKTAAPPGATCAVLPVMSQVTPLRMATARLNADPAWTLIGTFNRFDVWVLTS